MIRDSLSSDSIPLVTVTVEDLGQSFKTARSSFYVALPLGIYNFVLEAEGYEPLRKAITIDKEGEHFVLGMVKISDRFSLEKQRDSVNIYLNAFSNALARGEMLYAVQCLTALDSFGYPQNIRDSVLGVYQEKKLAYIDSLIVLSQALEDSGKFADAYYYYSKVINLDSLNETALMKIAEFDTHLSQNDKDVTGSEKPTEVVKISDEEIEEMYNSAISKFLEEDYKRALVLLKTVLKYKPNHEGAQNYLSRTKARLKFINN